MRTKTALLLALSAAALGVPGLYFLTHPAPSAEPAPAEQPVAYQPHKGIDSSGALLMLQSLEPLKDPESLDEIRTRFMDVGRRMDLRIDREAASGITGDADRITPLLFK